MGIEIHDDELDRLLQEFVAVAHVSAWWFNGRMKVAFRTRWVWFVVSLAAFISIVGAAYLAPIYLYPDDTDTMSAPQAISAVGANVTLLLTGVILVFRTVNSWVAGYADMSHYWQGRSDLLDLIYTLQTGFRGKDYSDTEEVKRLKVELETKIGEARTATRAAMDGIITSLQAPELNVDALTSAQTTASSLFAKLFNQGVTARFERLDALAVARAEAAAKEVLPAEIAALEASIQDTEARMLKLINLTETPEIPSGLTDTPTLRKHLIETYTTERAELIAQQATWKQQLAEKRHQLSIP